MSNKYRVGLMGAGLVLSLGLAGTAFAQTGGMHGFGGRGMRGNGVFGTVASINGNSLTVTSKMPPSAGTATIYTVDATNATVTKNGTASSVSGIAVGDIVSVQGTVSGTSVAATKINDGIMPGGLGGMRPGVFGTVASINGNTLTVTSKAGFMGSKGTSTGTSTTYTVDASKATITKNGTASSVSAIAVGDMISVQGTVTGITVAATKINDGMPPKPTPVITGNGEPVIAGTISAINGNTLTVTNKSNIIYTVDATSAVISVKNAKSTLSSVVVGDNVVIQGTVNGTNVTASSVLDQGAPKTATNASTAKPHASFFGSIGNFFKHLFGF